MEEVTVKVNLDASGIEAVTAKLRELKEENSLLRRQRDAAWAELARHGLAQGEGAITEAVAGSDTKQPTIHGEIEKLIDNCKFFVIREQKASVVMLQRRFHLGYIRAANILDELERRGVVGPLNKNGYREVLQKQARPKPLLPLEAAECKAIGDNLL